VYRNCPCRWPAHNGDSNFEHINFGLDQGMKSTNTFQQLMNEIKFVFVASCIGPQTPIQFRQNSTAMGDSVSNSCTTDFFATPGNDKINEI
jgi:3-phosphoglycerate kinase